MSVLGRIFSEKFHRSDASASWRWAAALSVVLGFSLIGGSLLSVIAISCGLVAWAYVFWDSRRFAFNQNDRVITFWFVGYVAVTAVIAFVNANPQAGLKEILKILPFLAVVPLAPVLRDFWKPYWNRWVQLGMIAGAVLSMPLATSEVYFFPLQRAELYTGNALILGYLAGVLCLSNLVLALVTRGHWRLLHSFASFLALWTINLSASRSPFLLTIGIGVVVLLVALPRRVGLWSPRFYGLLLVAVLALAIGVQTGAFRQTIARFENLWMVVDGSASDADESFSLRLEMTRAGLNAFMQHPMLGYGRQNVMEAANAQFDDDPVFPFTHLHNAFVTEAVASGLVGVILLAGVMATPIVAARGTSRPHRNLALVFTSYTLLYSMTNIGFYHDITASYFCFVVATLGSLPRSSHTPDTGKGKTIPEVTQFLS